MSTNVANYNKISDLVSLSSLRKPKIVLNPSGEYYFKQRRNHGNEDEFNANIIFDKTEWKIPEELDTFIEKECNDSHISNEDKILLIYDQICKGYTYDDNILSYIRKYDDKFALPDWYGRDVDTGWEQNREQHKRRVCYEVSRYLAKALCKVFEGNNDYNICILWDRELTHYFVGLSCPDYTLSLDLDDFNNIKDLTRTKAGLTADGIKILEDTEGTFARALDNFNQGRSKYAIKKITKDIEANFNSESQAASDEQLAEMPDDVVFLKNAIEILTDQYDIDSQGLFEYMKEIVDIKLGSDAREKIWKKLEGKSSDETRYTRCLTVTVDNQSYLIDVDEKKLRKFDPVEFEKEDAVFIPFKSLSRDWDERYNGM